MFAAVLVGCNRQGSTPAESKEAKQMLQGVWMDSEGGDVSFRVKGDTIFYSDTTRHRQTVAECILVYQSER